MEQYFRSTGEFFDLLEILRDEREGGLQSPSICLTLHGSIVAKGVNHRDIDVYSENTSPGPGCQSIGSGEIYTQQLRIGSRSGTNFDIRRSTVSFENNKAIGGPQKPNRRVLQK